MSDSPRTITRAARELQSAANKLELLTRNHHRDTILVGLFADVVKGKRAAERLEAQRPVMEALKAEVIRLRGELGTLLDEVLPEAEELPQWSEPPTKKRKKRK